jgi:mono/diheme cytochrome c family protein
MRVKLAIATILVLVAVVLAAAAPATPNGGGKNTSAAASDRSAQDDTLRLQGEKRFRANCGRCHTAPPKFAPRMTGTIVRHMRVRASLTDEDMRLIIRYMSQ